MSRLCILLSYLLFIAPGASAQVVLQSSPAQTHRLASAQAITAPVKCDADGNVYLRFPSASPASFDIVKLSPDGSQKATYRYSEVPEIKDAFVHDFAIGNDGKVYELAQVSGKRVFVVEFWLTASLTRRQS